MSDDRNINYFWGNQMEERRQEDQKSVGYTVFEMIRNRWASRDGGRNHKTDLN